MSLKFYTENEDTIKEESIDNYTHLFSSYENNLPDIKDALKEMYQFKLYRRKIKSFNRRYNV